MKKNKTISILAVITVLSLALNLFMIGTAASRRLVGDMDSNGVVEVDDAIYLLQHVLMPKLFPLPGDDFDAPEDDNPSDGEYGDYDGSEVTIRFAHTMGYRLQQVLNAHIQKFNELYPNIHVEHSSYGGWYDIASQINVEITAGNQPNIAYCYSDHVAGYNLANAVVTLDELINSTNTARRGDGSTENVGLTQAQADDFIDGFFDEGKVYGDGKMYTLPLSKSTDVLYYNKTFFEKNGLTVPTTWEEMETVCAKILELDSTCIPLGYDSEANWFITMCAQYGNDYTSATGDEHFLFNNDGNKAFVKMLRQWYQNGYTTTQNLYGGYTSGLFTELEYTRCCALDPLQAQPIKSLITMRLRLV